MKLTPEIEKIALQEAEEVGLLQRKLQGTTGRQVLNFVENFLDALPNSEPVNQFRPARSCLWYDGYPDNDDGGGPYETHTLFSMPQDYKAQLAESQAREAKLREALGDCLSDLKGGFVRCENCGDQEDTSTLDVVPIMEAALASPSDTTALNELIAKAGEVMRERCEKSLDDEECYAYFGETKTPGRLFSEALRAITGVTLEDL